MFRAKKHFFRMSLLTWFLTFSILCILAFAYTRFIRPSQVEARAIQGLKDLGIEVTFSYKPEPAQSTFNIKTGRPFPGPVWVKVIFGEKVLARISEVELSGEIKSLDECTEFLMQLKHLRRIRVESRELENVDALKHLKGLDEVELQCIGSKSLRSVDALATLNLSCVRIWQCNGLQNIDALANLNLSRVAICQCNGLTSLETLGEIASLKDLVILHCDGIRELNLSDWETKTLTYFRIEDCNQLVTVSGFPKSSQTGSLYLSGCEILEKVEIQRDSNLDRIVIAACPELASIDILPESLTYLLIRNCDSLTKIRWQQLPRLSNVDISGCPNLLEMPKITKQNPAELDSIIP